MRDKQKSNGSRFGRIVLILFFISGILRMIYSSLNVSYKANLNKNAETIGIDNTQNISPDTGADYKIIAISIAPDKKGVFYAISSDGKILVSHNSGKEFEIIKDTGIHCSTDSSVPQCRILTKENGNVCLFLRGFSYSIIGYGKNYGLSWNFKKVNFLVSDIFTIRNNQILYFSVPSEYTGNLYIKGFDFNRNRFVNVTNLDSSVELVGDYNVYPVKEYDNYIYFSLSDNVGRFAKEEFTVDKNGNLHCNGNTKEELFKAYMLSQIKDFCKISTDAFLIATREGIYILDLNKNTLISANRVVIQSKVFINSKNLFLHPVKLIRDNRDKVIFMLTKYNGIMVGKFVGKKFYWFPLKRFYVRTFSSYDLRKFKIISPNDRVLLMGSYFWDMYETGSVKCYDFSISYDPFYVLIATDRGLVRLDLKF